MKEINKYDLCNYVDPMATGKDWAIAVASDGTRTNGLTIGWAQFGTLWGKLAATVYIHKTRFSKQVFDGAEYYAICFMKPEQKAVMDYFGNVSGRDEDKMKNCGIEVETGDVAPYFKDSRVVVLCRVMGRSDFDPNSADENVKAWYQREGVHTLYHGEIVKVLVSE